MGITRGRACATWIDDFWIFKEKLVLKKKFILYLTKTLLYFLLVSSHTNKTTKDNLKFHFTTQLNW